MARLSATAACVTVALHVWAAGAAAGPVDPAAPPAAGQLDSSHLLDVPYLSQTEDLCGGAAVAMVLRYWGEREIYSEDFAELVDHSASGIRTDVLAADVIRRGWQALPLAADADEPGEGIGAHVDQGRPIVALIEVRPDGYHYVVIVAWTTERVIVHDPARRPFRVMSRDEFDRAWALAGRWALLLLPQEGRPADSGSSPALPTMSPTMSPTIDLSSTTSTCGALVSEMVDRAREGEVGAAEAGLLEAVGFCPRDPAAWRELAGVRFLQSRWAEAGTSAQRAVLIDPGDAQGWDLLATSRFLDDEPALALDAWNRIGRPSVDLVRVEGSPRTRDPVITALVDLPPRTLLTAERQGRAARRLQELPSAALTQLRYRPADGGLAEIDAAVVERVTMPRGVAPAVVAAARAWLQREIRLDVAAPFRGGELWTVAWRWWEARPRVAFALAIPALAGLPGVATIEWSWERPSYATPSAVGAAMDAAAGAAVGAIHREERRHAGLRLADWATSRVRWELGAAVDRWAEDSHLGVDADLDIRLAGDRVSVGIDTGAWWLIAGKQRFARAGVSSAWRSTRDAGRPSWSALAGFTAVSAASPFDLWPGAGTGHARAPLLRAHPLLDAGVVSGPVFGRQLVHGSVEYQRPLLTAQGGALQVAAFADTARAWSPVGDHGRRSWHADAGVGLRIALPGIGGTTRVDIARGLRDGRMALSAGWQSPWPGR